MVGVGLAGVKATKLVVDDERTMGLLLDEVDLEGFELVNSFCEQVESSGTEFYGNLHQFSTNLSYLRSHQPCKELKTNGLRYRYSGLDCSGHVMA